MVTRIHTDLDLTTLVQHSEMPILTEFWAPWCAPCKAIKSLVDEFTEDFDGHIVVRRVNIDRESKLAEHYSIKAVPTFILFFGGREIARKIGASSKQALADFVLDEIY